jgi:arylesterase/paraoxonase
MHGRLDTLSNHERNMEKDESFAASATQVVVRGRVEIPGPEDIVIDHSAGMAFVASQQRLSVSGKQLSLDEMPGGSIFGLDLNTESLTKRLLTDQGSLGFPFHPRGCSFLRGKDGQRRLMVISDRTVNDHAVEIFDLVGESFDGVALKHIQTVLDAECLISPNDLVALDGDRFYITNDHGARSLLLRSLEDLFGLPLSTVVFWDGSRCHTVARDIAFANGIALDCDRNRLYVAATRTKKIHTYLWDAGNPAQELTEFEPIDLPGCPDNLEWDEEGHLWIGADPSFVQLALYAASAVPTAPSLVLRIRFDGGTPPRVQEVWRDDTGEMISASSVAAVHGKGPVRRLLIGQPFGNHLLDCQLRTP